MAAVMETHVQIPADDSESQIHNHSESDEGQEGEEEGSDGEEAEDGFPEDDDEEDDEAEDEDGGDEADSEDVEDSADGNEGDENPNAGWAEAMAKILGKRTPESQTSILMKNKELEKIKEREREEQLQKKTQVDRKRAWEMMCRVKPDVVKDRETERALQRVATRGVVQLFNAVRKHQRTVEEKVKEVGGSERKKAKLLSSVSKKDFIDVLRGSEGGGGGGQHLTDKAPPPAEDQKPSWSVLRDDFMMGASMKDWDKQSEEEEGGGGGSDTD